MAETPRRATRASAKIIANTHKEHKDDKQDTEEEEEDEERLFDEKKIDGAGAPPLLPPLSLPETQLALSRLRERWELASVLNFLHVFKTVIRNKLEISAEEIEGGLIAPNDPLVQLHVSILQGIPPVSKTLTNSDGWVAALRKKLAPWWPWVADGVMPMVEFQGEEISGYNDLDPTTRLLILKALCEIRAVILVPQDDILSFVNDEMKKGVELSNFRKDKIAEDGKGIAYWYDGDSVIGHRLYKEVMKVELMPRFKGKGRLTQSINSFEWETLATNLEEFQQLYDKLSSSQITVEVSVAKFVESEVIPVLERSRKRKERMLKQQQRRALFSVSIGSYQMGYSTRSCRTRKPVNYTFDDYDKSIEEALQVMKRRKTTQDQEEEDVEERGRERDHHYDSSGSNDGPIKNAAEDRKLWGYNSQNETDDEDYDGEKEENEENDIENSTPTSSSKKEDTDAGRKCNTKKQKDPLARDTAGLRRSGRLNGSTSDVNPESHADMKETTQPEPLSSDMNRIVVSNSEDDNCSQNMTNLQSGTERESHDALEGLLEESEEEKK
ncbi:hypothetical protein Sjap_019867 [Stephania japonica]|uniref:DDT domain-containing protein DDR4 n=1 Tax=Stephania japonica TaxID=461633 RepID=A0AAP0HV47_9MAGN